MKKSKKKRRKPKVQLSHDDYLDPEQVRFVLQILKKQASDGKFRSAMRLFIFQLLLNTGLRRSEAADLQLRDLPCAHGKCQVSARWETTKGRRNREVLVSEEFRVILDEFVERFCKGKGPRSPLLVNEHGRPMTGYNIWCRIKTIGRRVGFVRLHPHALRHTYLSLLYGVSKDQTLIKDQGGHVKLDTTNIYIHIGDNDRKRQVSKIGWLGT